MAKDYRSEEQRRRERLRRWRQEQRQEQRAREGWSGPEGEVPYETLGGLDLADRYGSVAAREGWRQGPFQRGIYEGGGYQGGGGYAGYQPDDRELEWRHGYRGGGGLPPGGRTSGHHYTEAGYSGRPGYSGEASHRRGPEERWRQGEREGAHGGFAGIGPRGYRRSDQRMQDELCERLMRHPEVDASDVEVAVEEGVARLEGTVPDRWTKFLVEDLADSVVGVTEIENRLRLRRPREES